MNYLKCFNKDLLNIIIQYLNNYDLYNFANTYKIYGTKNIQRLIDFCYKCEEQGNELVEDWIGLDEEYHFQKMFNFNDPENIKLLSRYFKLKFFSKNITKNKIFVLEFIKNNPRNIRYAHVKFLDDKDIIMLVAKSFSNIKFHISERLEHDKDIIKICNLTESNYKSSNVYLNYPLKYTYFLNKLLTDNKYVEMRKKYYNNLQNEKLLLDHYIFNQEEYLNHIKEADNIYRNKYNLSDSTIIYRNDNDEVITYNEYFENYYKICGNSGYY